MKLKYWSWFLIFLVPFIGLAYKLFPNTKILVIRNVELSAGYFEDWSTLIWQLSPFVMSAIFAIVLIFALPRRTTPWQAIVALGGFLFYMVWNIERMTAGIRHPGRFWQLFLTLTVFAVVGGVLLYWKRRQKTDREKKEALLAGIDQLTAEDLPALFLALKDVELTAEEMKEHDFVWAWKQVLKNNVEYPKAITTAALQKFLELKAENA